MTLTSHAFLKTSISSHQLTFWRKIILMVLFPGPKEKDSALSGTIFMPFLMTNLSWQFLYIGGILSDCFVVGQWAAEGCVNLHNPPPTIVAYQLTWTAQASNLAVLFTQASYTPFTDTYSYSRSHNTQWLGIRTVGQYIWPVSGMHNAIYQVQTLASDGYSDSH